MKNIKEYLKSEDKEIILYHKNGEVSIRYFESSNGYWRESTYDENGNRLTFKNSRGYWGEYTYGDNGNELTYKNSNGVERGFDIEEMTMEEVCEALGKTIKITK